MSRPSPRVARRLKALNELARVTTAMIDGEEVLRIPEEQTLHYIKNPDPNHRFLALDHFVVDHEPFLRVKKLLLRIQTLADFPCSTLLFLVVEGLGQAVTPLVQNGNHSRYYEFGAGQTALAPEMKECLENGRIVEAPVEHPRGMLSVLAPVFDSMGDVVGLVELSAPNPVTCKSVPGYN